MEVDKIGIHDLCGCDRSDRILKEIKSYFESIVNMQNRVSLLFNFINSFNVNNVVIYVTKECAATINELFCTTGNSVFDIFVKSSFGDICECYNWLFVNYIYSCATKQSPVDLLIKIKFPVLATILFGIYANNLISADTKIPLLNKYQAEFENSFPGCYGSKRLWDAMNYDLEQFLYFINTDVRGKGNDANNTIHCILRSIAVLHRLTNNRLNKVVYVNNNQRNVIDIRRTFSIITDNVTYADDLCPEAKKWFNPETFEIIKFLKEQDADYNPFYSMTEFRDRLIEFSGINFHDPLNPFPFNLAVFAGGSVSKLIDRSYKISETSSDLDVWVIGAKKNRQINAKRVIDWFINLAKNINKEIYIMAQGSIINIMIDDMPRNYQIILSSETTELNIINNFDLSHIAIAYNSELIIPNDCRNSFYTRISKAISVRPINSYRIYKTLAAGFGIDNTIMGELPKYPSEFKRCALEHNTWFYPKSSMPRMHNIAMIKYHNNLLPLENNNDCLDNINLFGKFNSCQSYTRDVGSVNFANFNDTYWNEKAFSKKLFFGNISTFYLKNVTLIYDKETNTHSIIVDNEFVNNFDLWEKEAQRLIWPPYIQDGTNVCADRSIIVRPKKKENVDKDSYKITLNILKFSLVIVKNFVADEGTRKAKMFIVIYNN